MVQRQHHSGNGRSVTEQLSSLILLATPTAHAGNLRDDMGLIARESNDAVWNGLRP